MVTIALLSGSLRAGSANAAVLRAAARHLTHVDPVGGRRRSSCTQIAIDDLPMYSEDIEDAGWPEEVQHVRHAVAAADALIVSTPEYNGSMPGGLKNALDWLSRPYDASLLRAKPVATLSASPSPHGAKWAQDHLRHVLEVCGARLINAEAVVLPAVFDARDESGEIAERGALAAIRELGDAVLGSFGHRRATRGIGTATERPHPTPVLVEP
jgi:chromate reductase, NAD(P)H dehydrogenase (quinone)